MAGGWQVLRLISSFVTCAVYGICRIVTKAPLVESIDSSTGSGRHTPRICNIEEYREYVHIVKSDLGVQANGGTPNVAIESLHASAGYLNPPAYISFASSSYVNARSKIDKRSIL